MTKFTAAIASAVFVLVAPTSVVGLIPWWICRWHLNPPFLGLYALRYLGVLMLAAGVAGALDSIVRFVVKGSGTPAPVAPPQTLVVSGLYRFVRNPMYVSVVSAITGQALLFASVELLEYALAVWLCTHLFVCFYEEPHLKKKFGEPYELFLRHVPRWMPRLRPWNG
jgi:protein-S-isoprenylcysteine O-methyltransferase Ste14